MSRQPHGFVLKAGLIMQVLAVSPMLWLLMTALGQAEAEGPAHVMGRVLDAKSSRMVQVGVPGVVVKAYDTQDKLLTEALTGKDGEYRLEGVEPGTFLIVRHSKISYLRDPEIFKGTVPSEGITVYMGKRKADLAYYKEVGDAIVDRSTRVDKVCAIVNNRELCRDRSVLVEKALAAEWRSLREFAFAPNEIDVVRLQIAKRVGEPGMATIFGVDKRIAQEYRSPGSFRALDLSRGVGEFQKAVYFDSDEVQLSEEMKLLLKFKYAPYIAEASSCLSRSLTCDMIIEGHSDERGTNEYNMTLAERRASAVRDYFVSEGLNPDLIRIMTYGEERPVCTEAEEACWAQNRRVDFSLILRVGR